MNTRPTRSTSSLSADSVSALSGMENAASRRRDPRNFNQTAKQREDVLLLGVLASGVALLLMVSLIL